MGNNISFLLTPVYIHTFTHIQSLTVSAYSHSKSWTMNHCVTILLLRCMFECICVCPTLL